VRKRTAETTGELTAQEAHIAGLATRGLTNREIGAELYLSPRTVEWHLRKVFTKLGVGTRRELRRSLPDGALTAIRPAAPSVTPTGRRTAALHSAGTPAHALADDSGSRGSNRSTHWARQDGGSHGSPK
jgi:DNA-binding CsgD family transcriptional regulator